MLIFKNLSSFFIQNLKIRKYSQEQPKMVNIRLGHKTEGNKTPRPVKLVLRSTKDKTKNPLKIEVNLNQQQELKKLSALHKV